MRKQSHFKFTFSDEDVMKILMPIKEKLEEEGRYCIYSIARVVPKRSIFDWTSCILFYDYFTIFLVNTVVGETATLLNNYHSREKETNIGSLVADSMIDAVSIIIKIYLSKNLKTKQMKTSNLEYHNIQICSILIILF